MVVVGTWWAPKTNRTHFQKDEHVFVKSLNNRSGWVAVEIETKPRITGPRGNFSGSYEINFFNANFQPVTSE